MLQVMEQLVLHELHERAGARFKLVNAAEVVSDYGNLPGEYRALKESAGLLDFGFRSRICVTGPDRVRFLHGQITNDVKGLKPGQGCYAALISAKGRMESDLNVYCLEEELLIDFEPGLTQAVVQRLEKYIIADDVQLVDVAPHYGLLSVRGPRAGEVIQKTGLASEPPAAPYSFVKATDPVFGEAYVMNQALPLATGFDAYIPIATLPQAFESLKASTMELGGALCGWDALELRRVEAGIPRFGVDMDQSNFPLEAGLETRAISFNKGCYIGQEVISRIRTYSEVAKALRGLKLADQLTQLPEKGAKLFHNNKEVGYVTSAIASPDLKANLALGYVRKEVNQIGTELILQQGDLKTPANIVPVPFAC